MTKAEFPILFLGTPDFAVASLRKLVEGKWNIVAVITAPDKASGRGLKLTQSAVKAYAISQGIPVLQPTNLKSPQFLEELKSFEAKLQIVVAFRMLPREVWKMPPLGTFNLHASLLPNYRGAAPINWAIINGEKETGVTTFFLKHEIDEGQIIMQETEKILPSDTAGDLHDRLMIKGADLVIKTTQSIFSGNYESYDQSLTGNEKMAPKLTAELCKVDWKNASENIHNLIRGLSPYPCARSSFNGINYKIYRSAVIEKGSLKPEEIHTNNKSFLYVGTNDGIISILEIQKEGKKKMKIHDFLVGNKI